MFCKTFIGIFYYWKLVRQTLPSTYGRVFYILYLIFFIKAAAYQSVLHTKGRLQYWYKYKKVACIDEHTSLPYYSNSYGR